MYHTLNISDLAERRRQMLAKGAFGDNPDITVFDNPTPDYIVDRFNTAAVTMSMPEAFKINAVCILLCTAGRARIDVNFEKVEFNPGDVLVLNPNNLIELKEGLMADTEGYVVFLSPEFINHMSFDSSTLDYTNLRFSSPAVAHLDTRSSRIIEEYFRLMISNSEVNRENNVFTRNITRSLVGAMIYQLLQFRSSRALTPKTVADANRQPPSEGVSAADSGSGSTSPSDSGMGRRNYYIRDFMRLVAKHFREERSVAFYADHLYISAKYLSLIVKEATGHTATEWIDHYVILEAKNQLRYSGRNIQQIAYDLNFHNQSSFGKYFKHQTGLSPSEFRKS